MECLYDFCNKWDYLEKKKLISLFIVALNFMNTSFAAVGELSTDLVFIPITSCRIADSRYANNNQQGLVLAENIPLTANTTRSYLG
uniref:Uncharacterized protein n=1 Tax=uncultured bacterium A1Q1_fos_4 TaxID=1256574 RepID=L7VXU9_9BACT|nr:hypothetical protein [uncultured bacterium A1Q1_fos_4]